VHILTGYYIERARSPELPVRDLVVETMVDMMGPITLTTLTTMAGFCGIAYAEVMPPAIYFALFAALGVALAWVYSLIVLPCVMVLTQPKASAVFTNWQEGSRGWSARVLTRIGAASAQAPTRTSAMALALVAIALYGASQLRVDRALVEGFKPDEDIRIADEIINSTFSGTAFLDVMVESEVEEGLLSAGNMRRIRDLQAYMETLSPVQQTFSIVDYLSLLHQAMAPDGVAKPDRPLPTTDDAIAQYFLVYDSAGDPSDFDEEIDRYYEKALVRGVLNTRYYSQEKASVEALETYLRDHFNTSDLTGSVTGRVNVRYHWTIDLGANHAFGVALSLFLVFLLAALLFRSLGAGLVSVLPVSATVLCLYGVMGFNNIYLEPATTMFAAISLGVGVDFAIHLVARLRNALDDGADCIAQAIEQVMPETARACFFNALVLGCGFSVLFFSELLTLTRFGGIVTLAAFASFVLALVIVPAAYGLQERRRDYQSRRTALASS